MQGESANTQLITSHAIIIHSPTPKRRKIDNNGPHHNRDNNDEKENQRVTTDSMDIDSDDTEQRKTTKYDDYVTILHCLYIISVQG